MKLLLTQGLLASMAYAFPAAMLERMAEEMSPEMMERAAAMVEERQSVAKADAATSVFEPVPIFNEKQQFVDVGPGSGHEWQAPGKGDIRGPCPGLNAFANHGFLPRDGYPSVAEFIDVTTNVVGMGVGLATFLAVLGGFLDGDVLNWSIGGTPRVSIAGPIGNMGNGISGSHNKYESDASPTRPDLYEAGNDYKTMADQFNQMIEMSDGSITMDSLTNFRSKRFDTQVANNKYFFNGPFTGVLVQPAAYTFIYRYMANHSDENPYGYLSYDVVASWFGMEKQKNGKYKAKQGYERIPENWYKRAVEYPYGNAYFLADAANAIALHPKFANIGGNTGTTNSFTGVDVEDLTGGVYNGKDLLQGNKFACLAYQFAAQAQPDIATNAVGKITSAVGQLTSKLSCPQLKKIDQSQLEQFPGYTKSKVNY